jgi:hypothetical protein
MSLIIEPKLCRTRLTERFSFVIDITRTLLIKDQAGIEKSSNGANERQNGRN